MQTSNDNSISVLLVHDNPSVRQGLAQMLRSGRYTIEETNTVNDAITKVSGGRYHVILFGQKEFTTLPENIRELRSRSFTSEIICISDTHDADLETTVFQSGAFELLQSPFTPERLAHKIKLAYESHRLRTELGNLKQSVAMSFGFDNVVGISKKIRALKETVAKIAPTDILTLISGPSGSGKELLARTMHFHSPRRQQAFVLVDCANTPETILKDSFSNQLSTDGNGNIGETLDLLYSADHGTIFLKDVDLLPKNAQSVVARFLNDWSVIDRINNQPKKLNVRIIAASRSNLAKMAQEGQFSLDLYHRLNVYPLTIPSLNDRQDDIEPLVDYFLHRISAERGSASYSITRAAVDALLTFNWKENVRELENKLRRAVAVCPTEQIDAIDLGLIGSEASDSFTRMMITSTDQSASGGLMDSGQRTLILKALSDNSWNYTQTAQALGIGRTTLWRKIKKYELTPPADAPRLSLVEEVE